jgi:hypothetical protein
MLVAKACCRRIVLVTSSHSSSRSARRNRPLNLRRASWTALPCAEELEQRLVLATKIRPIGLVVGSGHSHFLPHDGPGPTSGLSPAQIRHAYGFDQLSQDGSGQTIAIVDAFYDPNIASDLQTFDQQFNLPAPPTFSAVDQNGNPASPSIPTDPQGGWEVEESLDVEWAHAIAPKANILLVEANSADTGDLLTAVDTARSAKGVVAVSMSWGGPEFSGEGGFDGHFTSPSGHGGVTFLASSGDNGAPASWPAVSPNIVAVGGTTLNLDGSSNRINETTWNGSGGGYSAFYGEPAYESTYAQSSYVQNTLNNKVLLGSPRGNPDVAYDADPNTGFATFDSYPYQGSPLDWVEVGGTSDAAPQWAGLIALADQGRGARGSLDGLTQTLPALYQFGASSATFSKDFYDITSGGNGYGAVAGYDLATGVGVPVANNLVPDLVKAGASTFLSLTTSTATPTAGTPFSVTVTAENASGQTLTNYGGTIHFTTTDAGKGFALPPDYTFTSADLGTHTFTNLVTLVTAGSQTITATDTGDGTITGQAGVTVGSAAASGLSLSAPSSASQFGPFDVTVTARDAYGNTATGYAGTVHFTSSDTGTGVTLPPDYSFGPSDQGSHTFAGGVTLVTLGNQTVTAADTASSKLKSSATVNVQPAGSASHFTVSAPSGATAGSTFTITVTALDANNNTATGYRGTAHFTSSDAGTGFSLPQDYTFVAGDHGRHSFTNLVTLVTAGKQTVTATDKAAGTITGSVTVTVGAAAASQLAVTGYPTPVAVGTPGTFTVTAEDKYGNTATGYAGTVTFSSSDQNALLPGNSPLTNGVGTFSATFETVGTQSLTATDTLNSSIAGSQTGIQVVSNPPSVFGLYPNYGPDTGGTPVMIYGSNLGGATAVYFGTTPATITSDSDMSVGVITPAHVVGVVDVTVVTPGGTSPITPFDQFTYQSTFPTVTSVSPNSGSVAGGYMVVISGTNLNYPTAVYFGTTPATILGYDNADIGVLAPAAQSAGTVDVTVVTPAGTSPVTPADQFTYTGSQSSGPTVSSVSPNSGSTAGGYMVVISGTNLNYPTAVYFGTTPAAIIGYDDSSVGVIAPPAQGPGTVDVTVVTSAGTSPISPADQFTYAGGQSSGPTVTSVGPNSGSTAGGYTVTISGTNLGGATAVNFGTVPASIQSDSPSSITVTAPANAAGTVDVTVVTPAGTSPNGPADQFTYTTGGQGHGPVVMFVNPNSGSTAGGDTVIVSGMYLGDATAVYFGTTPATIVLASGTGDEVISPAHAAGTVDITVVTPEGTSPISSADQFTYTGGQSSGPTVTGISANTGSTAGGYPVTISGTNLGGATAAYFGTVQAAILSDSGTSMTVTAPPQGPGTVDVTVVTPAGMSPTNPADKFTYTSGQSSGPTVTGISPNTGSTAGGYQVTIYGTNLSGATTVYFGTVPAGIQSDSAGSITVVVPANVSGTVDVTVVTPAGTSPTGPADQFTYTGGQGHGPVVMFVNPNSGSTAGGDTVIVSGMFLGDATTVYFGTTPATILLASGTGDEVISPAHAAGTVGITVVTPEGTSPISPADRFTYLAPPPAPSVQGVKVNHGLTTGGYQVTVTGTGLKGATAVYFGGTKGAVQSDTGTSVVVTAPASAAGTVDVTVVTPGGTSHLTSADRFTYTVPPPAVTFVGPTGGSTAGGFSVAITGTNFTGATAVYFGTTAATILGVSATAIAVTAPAHAAGKVDVSVVTPAGKSAIVSADAFTYTSSKAGVPTVQMVSPNTGSTLGGFQVVLYGTNLGSATAVYFGTTKATVLVESVTAIVVTVPAHAAGKVDVTVVTPLGKSATGSADRFTYKAGAAVHIAALDQVLAVWSPKSATALQASYLIAEVLTDGGVANLAGYYIKKK